MTQKIQVEELPSRPGERVIVSAVGPHPQLLTIFEIRKVGKGKPRYDYWVGTEKVTREVYRDAMDSAVVDRFCAGCVDEHEDDESDANEVLS